MVIPQRRARATLLAGCLLVSCSRMTVQLPQPDLEPTAATLTFRNQSRERIYVYLIEEREEQLLGRLEQLETARLRLPVRSSAGEGGMIRLAVVAGEASRLQPSRDSRAILSVYLPVQSLVGQNMAFVAGQLTGPWSPRGAVQP
jgi:hypothetical protein